jgi:putative acetyltransferase
MTAMDKTDWKSFWDDHYAAGQSPWIEPDPLFIAEAVQLPPGRALDLGCGEGASSLWLAAHGWDVTAVDFAANGIAALQRLASERGVNVAGVVADILDFRAAAEFDLVTLGYMHLEPEKRQKMLAAAATALKPGGVLIYLGFDRERDLSHVGFPHELVATQAELRSDLPELVFERLETVTHKMDFGDGPVAYPVIVARAIRAVPTGLVIEPGDPHEAQALLEASHAMMLELFNPEANHFLSLDALAAPDIHFFVARLDGNTVGCGALAIRDGYGEIKSVFVDPSTRRAGVAAGLMQRLEAEAASHGLKMLKLETGDLLEAAHALYRRHGFTICGPFGSYPEHPQSVFMEKRLT